MRGDAPAPHVYGEPRALAGALVVPSNRGAEVRVYRLDRAGREWETARFAVAELPEGALVCPAGRAVALLMPGGRLLLCNAAGRVLFDAPLAWCAPPYLGDAGVLVVPLAPDRALRIHLRSGSAHAAAPGAYGFPHTLAYDRRDGAVLRCAGGDVPLVHPFPDVDALARVADDGAALIWLVDGADAGAVSVAALDGREGTAFGLEQLLPGASGALGVTRGCCRRLHWLDCIDHFFENDRTFHLHTPAGACRTLDVVCREPGPLRGDCPLATPSAGHRPGCAHRPTGWRGALGRLLGLTP